MTSLWVLLGRLFYRIGWPVLSILARFNKRVRVVVAYKREILVTKVWLGEDVWSLPGGGVHRNEDPRDAASRELYEELGIRIAPVALKPINEEIQTAKNRGIKYKYWAYFANLEHKLTVGPRQWEITDAAWIDAKHLLDEPLDETSRAIVSEWLELSK